MSLATRPSPAALKRARKLSHSIGVLPVDDQIGLIEKAAPTLLTAVPSGAGWVICSHEPWDKRASSVASALARAPQATAFTMRVQETDNDEPTRRTDKVVETVARNTASMHKPFPDGPINRLPTSIAVARAQRAYASKASER
jgi:hypothetical protein